MKKLIIIGHEPLTIRLKKIFCIDSLINRNIKIQYWDLSQFFFPKMSLPDTIVDDYISRFNDLASTEKAIQNTDIQDTVFVIEVFNSYENIHFFKMLKNNNCFCIKIDLYANTALYPPPKVKLKRIFSLNNLDLKKIFFYFYIKYFQSNPYQCILSSSTLSHRNVNINHPDYEDFFNDSEALIEGDYILFLDTYYPLHPDLIHYFKSQVVDISNYRNLMKKYFCFLEQKFNKRVVIAAHPKSVYSGGEFGNRMIVKNQTNNLVKHASFVITHESNALSYIALSNKSFAFVYPNTYEGKLMNYLNTITNYCKKKGYNLNKCNWNDIEYKPLDEEIRKKYIYNFLTSKESENRKNADIIYDQLR